MTATEYHITVSCSYDWADYVWSWSVRRDYMEAKGCAATRWGAKRAARRAVRRWAKGKPPVRLPKPDTEEWTVKR